jgi:hypothetical protein
MAVLAAVAVAVAGCGGSATGEKGGRGEATTAAVTAGRGGIPADSVAVVGGTPVTRAAVNHWMGTLAGGDYYGLSGHAAIPAGLVAEPPNYAGCVAALEAAAAKASVPTPPGPHLLTKCQQLYQALKVQATAFLVNSEWIAGAYREEGIEVTEKEVLQRFQRWRVEHGYVSAAALSSYLSGQRRSQADQLVVLKLDLLSDRAQQKFKAGGQAELTRLTEAGRRWTRKTDCRPGYVVERCRQYGGAKPPSPALPSASVLMEQVAALATGRCINRPACAKQ